MFYWQILVECVNVCVLEGGRIPKCKCPSLSGRRGSEGLREGGSLSLASEPEPEAAINGQHLYGVVSR